MSAYELFDIGLAIGNRVDVQWGLFITVHLAIFGAVIYIDRPLRLPEKAGAMVIYGAFAVLNFRVLRVQMELMHQAYGEIADLAIDDCCLHNRLVEHVAADVASGRFALADTILVGGHLLMAFLVVISIVFDKAIGSASHGQIR